MSAPGHLRRRTRAAIAAGAVLSLCLVPAVSASAASRGHDSHGSKHGSKHGHGRHHDGNRVGVQILSFNDFHGNLEPPAGSGGRITTGYTETSTNPFTATPTNVDAGGIEYLATHLRDARQGHRNSVTVAAGDLIGASPLLSAAFHDEPTIEALNALGLQATSVGNHEFDEGFTELLRMQSGGCIDDGDGANNQNSCADHIFPGANFQYLAANVKFTGTEKTILPPYWIKKMHGVKIGFIGMTLKETPTIVTKSGVEGLDFTDEVATANALVPVLHKKGVKAIVVLVHQGGVPNKTTFTGASGHVYTVDPTFDATCAKGATLTSDSAILPIAENLDPEIDMVISGHTHQPYVCDIPDPKGHSRLVTSASSFGRLFTDTELTYDKRKGDIVRSSVKGSNLVVTRDVPKAPDITALIAKYQALVAPIANRVVGNITADVNRVPNAAGETPLGDLIADAQLADPSLVVNGQAPVIAFMNPGGIRADLSFASSPKGEGDGVVTFEEAFTVQPFNNFDVSMTMTGADIYTLLDQQWTGLNAGTNEKVLQVSKGFTYTRSNSGGPHVVPGSVALGGVPIANDASQTFRVTANNFLSDGGDNFAAFTQATGKVFGGLDIDAFANFLPQQTPAYTPTVPPTRITLAP
jgi:5'-nucleotidase